MDWNFMVTFTTSHCSAEQEFRLSNIGASLLKTLRTGEDEAPPDSEFDYSLPAVCDVPKHTNLSEWFGQKTWNIYFKPNYRQYNIKTLTLR
jgi:hypothetical protein